MKILIRSPMHLFGAVVLIASPLLVLSSSIIEAATRPEEKDKSRAKNDDENKNRFRRNLRTFRDLEEDERNKNNIRFNQKTTPSKQIRIVGGIDAEDDEFPTFVSLGLGCGGSLISSNLVLTAAHCLLAPWSSDATIGAEKIKDSNGLERRITGYAIHPKYSFTTNNYDFAIMRLEDEVPASEVVPIALNRNKMMPANFDDLTVIGLGTIGEGGKLSESLQKITVPSIPHNYCSRLYQGGIKKKSMICAGGNGKDSCQGDSGGPLTSDADGSLVGVVSFGFGCATGRFPGVYSRVSGAIEWIDEQICLHQDNGNSSNLSSGCNNEPELLSSIKHPITFQIKYDAKASKTSWNLRDGDEENVFSSPLGSGSIGTVSNTINLQPGTYTFEIEYIDGEYNIIGSNSNENTKSQTSSPPMIEQNSNTVTQRSSKFVVSDDGSIEDQTTTTNTYTQQLTAWDQFILEVLWLLGFR